MQEYGTTNFYKRRTTASYLEFQTKFDKINFIVVVVPKITTSQVKTDVAVEFIQKQFFFQCKCTVQF
jgi:hypothetical protein